MRLSKLTKQKIISAFEEVFKKHGFLAKGFSLYLFGSRTKDALKGGDIDLLLRVPPVELNKAKKFKIDFLVMIQNHIGEQKIDLLIIDDTPPKDPFHTIAVEQALILKKW